jgi:hypothetical protein
MLSDDAQYRWLTSQIADRVNKCTDALKLFVQMFSAIVGGSIYLASAQTLTPAMPLTYRWLSSVATLLLTGVCVAIIIDARRSWCGYRRSLTTLFPEIPAPKVIRSSFVPAVMVLGMLIAAALFCCWFNPFVAS